MASNLSESMLRRSHRIRFGVFLAATAAIYFFFLFPSPEYPVLNKDDGSLFLTLGINIAELGRYSMDTTAAAEYGRHATWPPVFPLYLSAVVALFGVSWPAIKLGMVVLGLATLVALWRLLPKTWEGMVAIVLTAINPFFFLYSHHTMAEVPYMLGIALTLWGLDRSVRPSHAVLAGLFGALAFLTRGYGVVLLPAGVIFFLIWRTDRTMLGRIALAGVFAAPMLVAILGWAWYSHATIDSGIVDGFTARYGNGSGILSGLLRPPLEQLQTVYWQDARYISFLMLPVFDLRELQSSALTVVLSGLLLLLATIGYVAVLREQKSSVLLWLPMAVGLTLAAESRAARYWLPYLPFLFYFVLKGVGLLRSGSSILCRLIACAFIVTGLLGLVLHLHDPDEIRYYDRHGLEFKHAVLWARENLPREAIVVTESPGDVYAGSRRRATSIRTGEDAKLGRLLDAAERVYLLCPTSSAVKAHYPQTYTLCSGFLARFSSSVEYESSQLRLYRLGSK